jgi:hypothetical protein
MAIQRTVPRTSTIEVLDRILDKGVVIDAQVRVSLVGLHLVDIDARVIVSSIQTYVKHAAEVAEVQRQPRATLVTASTTPQVSEPAARRTLRRRRPRRRAQALIAYRCQRGCTFWRSPSSPTGGATAVCTYQPDATCELQRV